jgi:pyruvate dehydrogenase E2 component (dihydrolipoamide acetyltransferase)
MLQSVQSTPQFSLLVETDATGLLSLRDSLEARVQSRVGVKLTLSMLFVKIVAGVLKNHPRANASFEEGPDGQPGVRLHPRVNCGVAVGSEEGLLVPVIHDAGARSLDEIALRLNELVEQIKSMRLAPADLEGGTFTISNLGMYGIRQFNAILNPPQSAILAIGAVTRRMVETPAGLTEMRPLVNLTLTADHRVLDGLQAARFLADLRAGIENPIDLMEKVA